MFNCISCNFVAKKLIIKPIAVYTLKIAKQKAKIQKANQHFGQSVVERRKCKDLKK